MPFIIEFILLVGLFLVLPVLIFRGAPFIATDKRKVQRIVALVKPKAGERAADLGSGDGRLVIALAQQGIEVHGYEVNPLLVAWSRYRIRRAGLAERAFIHQQSYWHIPLADFDVITMFGAGGKMMVRLAEKFMRESKPGARLVSNGYELPSLTPTIRDRSLYLYQR